MDHLHPELRLLAQMMTESITTNIFKIEYGVDIYVKHQSKTEFGQGNFVTFPIEVRKIEIDLPWAPQKLQTWLQDQKIDSWQPTVSQDQVYLSVEKNSDGTFKAISAAQM